MARSSGPEKRPKILVPVDGSPCSDRVIDQLVRQLEIEGPMDLHLINVQMPVDSGHARMFVSADDVEAYHREEGMLALSAARQKLDAAGIPFSWHVVVGRVAETLVRFAQEHGFDGIVMGTHGRGGLANLLLGSVAKEVSRSAVIPVTLVK